MYCDNYARCNSLIDKLGLPQSQADERARLKGWRVWRGTTLGGTTTDLILCPRCGGNTVSIKKGRELDGQLELPLTGEEA